MKTYIAGKVTGLDNYAELFEAAKKEVIEFGGEPVSPIELPHNHDKRWVSYMKECLICLLECEAAYFLKNWRSSEGATMENTLCRQLKIKIIYQ